MTRLREKLKHAFAVDPSGPAEPTREQQASVDWVCRQVARRRLTTPGLVFLETVRPLNYVGAQFLHVMAPAFWALSRELTYEHYTHFSAFLERRGSLEYMARRIEHFEEEFEREERQMMREK